MSSTPQSHPTQYRATPKRAATVAGLLGVLSAVVLAGGTGFAYAASTDAVETGYLTVVDEGTPATSSAATGDCPEDASTEDASPEDASTYGSGATGGGL